MYRALQRKAIESLYIGLCTVIEFQSVEDPISHVTTDKEVTVLENQPCKLSFERTATTDQTSAFGVVVQSTKLFIAPEIDIKPGSKIVVTQRGRTETYTHSGKPAYFSSHQEIQLDIFKGWA